MKKTLVARGIGLLSLVGAIGAAGCSADVMDEGAAGEGEIGVTEQAITALPTTPTDVRAFGAAACAFKDGSDRYSVLAGGITSAGAPTARILLEKNSAGWNVESEVLSQARTRMKVVQLSDTACAVFGGSSSRLNGGTAYTNVDVLELNTGTNPVSITQTPGTSFNAGREDAEMSWCVDEDNNKHLVVIGGSGETSVEVGPFLTAASVKAHAWTKTDNILNAVLTEFGADTNGVSHIVVAGGRVAGGNATNLIDIIPFTTGNNMCTPSTAVRPQSGAGQITTLSVAMRGNVVFFDATAQKFVVTAGIQRSGGVDSMFTNGDVLTPNFSGTPKFTAIAAMGAITGQYEPALVRSARTGVLGNTFNLFGGASDAAVSTSSNVRLKYANGTLSSPGNLTTAAHQIAASEVVDSLITLIGGQNTIGANADLTQTLEVAP